MKSPLFACLFSGLLFLSTVTVHAQSCPEGYEVTGGQGAYGCAPRPDNDNYYQQQQQAPQPPPEQWTNRWMAIATDSVKGSLGTATDMTSRENAEQSAIANCRTKGGTQCKLDVSYGNGCAAMIVGDGGYNSNGAATLDEAVQLGMKVCAKAGHTHCHIYYSACSLPVRIQ